MTDFKMVNDENLWLGKQNDVRTVMNSTNGLTLRPVAPEAPTSPARP